MATPRWSRRRVLQAFACVAGGSTLSLLAGALTGPTPARAGAAPAVGRAASRAAALQAGDTLVIGVRQTSRTDEFDVSQTYEFQTKMYGFCVSESLVFFDYRDLQYKPRLAESWEIGSDAKSITFKLRQGVKFHDGTPFNADAVVFNFDRIFIDGHPDGKDATFYYRTAFPYYERTEKIDDHTVRVHLSQPDALILQRFAHDTAYLANPVGVRKYGNRDYSTDPAKYSGTGPYRAVELRPKELVRLERNEEWWGSPKPAFKTLIFQLTPPNPTGDDARLNALLARELDVAFYLPGTRRNDIARAADQGLEHRWFPQFVLNYYYLNHTRPFFQDKRVRQAIARSFDRVKFYEATQGPTVIPFAGFWYPESPFYNPDARLDFDPERAKQLLEEAGFTQIGGDGIRTRPADGLRAAFAFQWSGLANQQPPDDIVFWSQQLKELLGVETTIQATDPGLRADFEKGPLAKENLGILAWGVGTFLGDPEFAYNRWICDERTPKGFNASQYCNEALDALFKQSRTELDQVKRIALFKQMQAIAAEDVPWIPASIATMGGAWWSDRVANVTAGATQYTYPWTYTLPG